MKELGVQRILAPSAVGSLREEFKPGDVVFVDQFIDRTTKREQSFYAGPPVCHISVAEPMCPELRGGLIEVADEMKISYHKSGTYVCIEGPRFSTKAESRMFRSWDADIIGMTLVPECVLAREAEICYASIAADADIIGMTLVPECVLAREAEICYASIAAVTDYDVWKDHPVSADEVRKTMNENIEKIKDIITGAISRTPKDRRCECGNALRNALIGN